MSKPLAMLVAALFAFASLPALAQAPKADDQKESTVRKEARKNNAKAKRAAKKTERKARKAKERAREEAKKDTTK